VTSTTMLHRQLLRVAQQTARPAVRVPITRRIRPFSVSAQFRAEQPENPVDPRDPQITELKVHTQSLFVDEYWTYVGRTKLQSQEQT
jgi:hypothetical protein